MVQFTQYHTSPAPTLTAVSTLDTQADTLVWLATSQQWQQITAQQHLSNQLDATTNALIMATASAEDFSAKAKQNLYITISGAQGYARIVVLGLGDDNVDAAKLHTINQLGDRLYNLIAHKSRTCSIDMQAIDVAHWSHLLLGLLNASYHFNHFKTSSTPDISLQHMSLVHSDNADLGTSIAYHQAVYSGQAIAKTVANLPANICYPEYMAQMALALQAQYPDCIKVTIVDQADMQKLGMGCFVAVSQGSAREGKLVIIEYRGNTDDDAQPIALVGKGVTFDTGGISLKPAAGMDEMKYDMAGAASVLGVMHSLCQAQLAVYVVGALACAENMPSGHATRPGDIVTALDGQTVEILNTDAEGRLVLCDTLTYIQQYNPRVIIDIATLTGACVVALGKVVSGLFTTDSTLANELTAAGNQSYDRVWAMPLLDDYQELLDSPFADMANIGGPTAGSITAACFLSRFTKGYRWAHLDIAGTGWISGKNKSATGRPVPLLMQYLANQVR